MRSRTLVAGAALAVVALVLPADAAGKAQITDPAGDANALNGQGLVTGGQFDGGNTTSQQLAQADLLSVTYSTTYDTVEIGEDGLQHVITGVQARIVTTAPAVSTGPTLIYRLNADIGGCGGFLQAYVNGPASAPTDGRGLEFRQFAARGCLADVTKRGFTAALDEEGALVFDLPYALMDAAMQAQFAPKKNIGTVGAEVRTQIGTATAPAIDTTLAGANFRIGSDVPADVPCTVGCPGQEPVETAAG